MTVARSYSGTASASVTAGAESEVGTVLAKAKVSISATLTGTNGTTATSTCTQNVATCQTRPQESDQTNLDEPAPTSPNQGHGRSRLVRLCKGR